MTVDERIDQLISELHTIGSTLDPYAYQVPGRFDLATKQEIHPKELPAVNKIRGAIKQFMQDMGSDIVKSQAIDEFVEYLKEYGEEISWLDNRADRFKKQQGYE